MLFTPHQRALLMVCLFCLGCGYLACTHALDDFDIKPDWPNLEPGGFEPDELDDLMEHPPPEYLRLYAEPCEEGAPCVDDEELLPANQPDGPELPA